MKQKLKKEDIGFTQIKNDVLVSSLSLQAKGLYCYLYSKPDNWNFSAERIAVECNTSRNTILKYLKELEDNGYLERKKLKTGRVDYFIYKKPKSKNRTLDSEKPKYKKATVQKSHGAKFGPISNKELYTNKDYITNKDIVADATKEKKFDLKSYYEKMFSNKDKRMAIIAGYWIVKGFKFENEEQTKSAIKRELRPAGDLKGYSFERIKETMLYLKENANFKWTLETVGKFINEDLKELKKEKPLIVIEGVKFYTQEELQKAEKNGKIIWNKLEKKWYLNH
ncbi:helix-turn-helix domain-containing protein [Persephonella sp.]